jgi:hypothetical protein
MFLLTYMIFNIFYYMQALTFLFIVILSNFYSRLYFLFDVKKTHQ